MRRAFPKRLLLVPTRRASFAVLQDLELELPDTVIWLDDLEGYLGADGLTTSVLDYFIDAPASVTILATMRVAEYAKYGPEHHALRLERKVLERARVIRLERKLNDEEQVRAAEQGADPRIAATLLHLHRYGLAEYLAAGPALLERFKLGGSVDVCPVGAAIVRAAVDWRRMGLSRPIPKAVLWQLAAAYPRPLWEEVTNKEVVDTEQFNSGLAWAQVRIYGTVSLLRPEGEGYVPFDYLVDEIQRSKTQYPIPDSTWTDALKEITEPAEAIEFGVAAMEEDQYQVAEEAYRIAVSSPSSVLAEATLSLGYILKSRGELEEARTWLSKATKADDRIIRKDAACYLGELYEKLGELDAAEDWFRQAAIAADPDAAGSLADLLERRGAMEEAVIWRMWAIVGISIQTIRISTLLPEGGRELKDKSGNDHSIAYAAMASEVATAVASLLKQQGDIVEAEVWTRRAMGAASSASGEYSPW
jgi:uncharacterized protein